MTFNLFGLISTTNDSTYMPAGGKASCYSTQPSTYDTKLVAIVTYGRCKNSRSGVRFSASQSEDYSHPESYRTINRTTTITKQTQHCMNSWCQFKKLMLSNVLLFQFFITTIKSDITSVISIRFSSASLRNYTTLSVMQIE